MAITYFYRQARRTHLWLVYQRPDVVLYKRHTEKRLIRYREPISGFQYEWWEDVDVCASNMRAPGPILAGIYCKEPKLEGFMFERVQAWCAFDGTGRVARPIDCDACKAVFGEYKAWLARGGSAKRMNAQDWLDYKKRQRTKYERRERRR